MYEIRLHPKAAGFLKSIPKEQEERIKQKLRETSSNPFAYLEHYEGADFYKLRIGHYRALIDIDFERKILFVRVLDKRGRIYKRRH